MVHFKTHCPQCGNICINFLKGPCGVFLSTNKFSLYAVQLRDTVKHLQKIIIIIIFLNIHVYQLIVCLKWRITAHLGVLPPPVDQWKSVYSVNILYLAGNSFDVQAKQLL